MLSTMLSWITAAPVTPVYKTPHLELGGDNQVPERNQEYTGTLIFDLDETLVYARHLMPDGSLRIDIRQDVVEKLKALEGGSSSQRWELILWTAARKEHAEHIDKELASKGVKSTAVLSSNSCGRYKGFEKRSRGDEWPFLCIKDIRRLKHESRPVSSMYIVDNTWQDCLPQDRTIAIRSWYGWGPQFVPKDEREPDSLKGADGAMEQLECTLKKFRELELKSQSGGRKAAKDAVTMITRNTIAKSCKPEKPKSGPRWDKEYPKGFIAMAGLRLRKWKEHVEGMADAAKRRAQEG